MKWGDIVVKIGGGVGKGGDMRGGVGGVSELFEGGKGCNGGVVCEMDGEIRMGKIKGGKGEMMVRWKSGEVGK